MHIVPMAQMPESWMLLTQQVLNGQIGSPKSFEFQEFFSQGKQRLRTLIFFLMFPYVPNFNPQK
jgi:hypothetical protein